MEFVLRCLVLSMGAFGAFYVAASWLVARRTVSAVSAPTPASKADALLRLRVFPLAIGAAALTFATVGLLRFESRDTDEVLGLTLWAAALIGTGIAGVIISNVVAQQVSTRRLWRSWMSDAEPVRLAAVDIPAYRIRTGFPVVAVVGVVSPKLVIDAKVLEGCDAEELAAIVAHEQGHLRRRDNLRRAIFAALPGLWIPRGLPDAWREATEEAADDAATEAGENSRLHLASALIRVARLGQGADPTDWLAQLPASALYRGETIERRVRRLLDGPEAASAPRRGWGAAVVAVAITTVFALQQDIHDLMEVLVAVLP